MCAVWCSLHDAKIPSEAEVTETLNEILAANSAGGDSICVDELLRVYEVSVDECDVVTDLVGIDL